MVVVYPVYHEQGHAQLGAAGAAAGGFTVGDVGGVGAAKLESDG